MAQVSVVIPLYNKERQIDRALDSVLMQDFTDFELIVVDDGSTDSSPQRVEARHDPRLRLIRQANGGPGAARNRGLTESVAPLITFLDADDEWLPGFLRECVAFLSSHPACALIVSGFRFTQREGGHLESNWIGPRLGLRPGPWKMPPFADPTKTITMVECMHFSSMLLRREIVERYGGFYAKNRCTYGEDSYLCFQILANHPVYWDPKVRAVVHSEDSSLGVGRKTLTPVRAVLNEPEPIWRNTPPEYRGPLELAFAYYALHQALDRVEAGRIDEARDLLNRHPLARSWRRQFLQVRMTRMLKRVIGWKKLRPVLMRALRRRAKPAADPVAKPRAAQGR